MQFRGVVTYDLWLLPLDPEVLVKGLQRVPLLNIISEQWLNWKPHHIKMEGQYFLLGTERLRAPLECVYCIGLMAQCSHAGSRYVLISGTRHSNFSDVALFSQVRLHCS